MFGCLSKCQDLDQVQGQVIRILKTQALSGRLGLVSGAVNADGPERVQANLRLIQETAKDLTAKYEFPVISCGQVFSPKLRLKLTKAGYGYMDYVIFWRKLLASKVISHVFMLPGWQRSTGARDEHATAIRLGLKIVEL